MLDRLIFGRPRARRVVVPGPHAHALAVRELRLLCPDGVALQGWRAGPVLDGGSPRVLVYFGGRNEDVCWTPGMASHLAGWTVYAFNYRGFGGSGGRASERSARRDARTIWAHLRGLHPQAQVQWAVMGRSLGTALAVWLAREVQPGRLVLLSPFCSLGSVVRAQGWLGPLALLLSGKFRAIASAPQVAAPTLVLLAQHDRQVLHQDSRRLAAALGGPVRLAVVPHTSHQSLPRHVDTQALLREYFSH